MTALDVVIITTCHGELAMPNPHCSHKTGKEIPLTRANTADHKRPHALDGRELSD